MKSDEVYQKKMRRYLAGLLEDEVFQGEIAKIRNKHNLTKNWKISDECLRKMYTDVACNHPNCTIFFNDEFQQDSVALASVFGFHFLWVDVLQEYIIFNKWSIPSYLPEIDIVDIPQAFFCKSNQELKETVIGLQEDISKYLPIAIQFTPYASERDLIEFIKMNFKKKIIPLQKTYRTEGIKVGKFRKRDSFVKERNNFIYKHRKLPIKQLCSLVAEKYKKTLDYTYIQKIIRDEIRKRK